MTLQVVIWCAIFGLNMTKSFARKSLFFTFFELRQFDQANDDAQIGKSGTAETLAAHRHLFL